MQARPERLDLVHRAVQRLEGLGRRFQRTRRQQQDVHPEAGRSRLHAPSPQFRTWFLWPALDVRPVRYRRGLCSVTDVTRDYYNHVTRARVTPISRFPVTCVTSLSKRGLRTGRCRHACRNAEVGASGRCIMRSPGRGSNLLRMSPLPGRTLPMRFPLPHDRSRLIGNSLIALLNRHRRPICPNHVVSVGEGFSRALSHELQHSWKLTHARGSRPIVRQIPMVWPGEIQDRRGVGEIPRACPDFMSSPFFAAAPEKIGGVLSENFRPQRRHLHTGVPR